MNELVFISDLHLHPKRLDIQARFDAFIQWAKTSTKAVYILGDFFHVWVGDDALDDWSKGIARQIAELKASGIDVFYMPGNRDFLLGQNFAALAGWKVLREPSFIQLASKKVMLTHGDAYCTLDKGHQRLRCLTRNRWFSTVFLCLPLSWRQNIANRLKAGSKGKSRFQMDAVESSILDDMKKHQADTLIHGHTHQQGISRYQSQGKELFRYVLSDWDDRPFILSYNRSKGLYFDFI